MEETGFSEATIERNRREVMQGPKTSMSIGQSLVLQSPDERAEDYGPCRAHSSRLHGHSQVCWVAIADAMRPFRP